MGLRPDLVLLLLCGCSIPAAILVIAASIAACRDSDGKPPSE